MKRKLVTLMLAIAVIVSLVIVGCAKPAPAPTPAKTWELKLSIEVPDTAPLCVHGFKPWAEEVEKATNGRVKVVIYPSGTLCKVGDMLDAVGTGIADVGWCWPGLQKGVAPLSEVMNIPMLYDRAEVGSHAIWDVYEQVPEVQAEYDGYKLLSMWSTDAYVIGTIDKPVRKMEDLKGLKLRAANTMTADFIENLGAAPVFLRMPDVYMALEKGTMDGTTTSGEAILGWRFCEVLKYYVKPGVIGGGHILIMNDGVWNSMPPDVQEQLMSVSGGVLSTKIDRDVFGAAIDAVPGELEKMGKDYEIIQLSPEEIERWRKVAAEPAQVAWVAELEGKGLPAQKVLDMFKSFVEKYQS